MRGINRLKTIAIRLADAEKTEIQASSFDKLRMRSSDFNDMDLLVSLSWFGATRTVNSAEQNSRIIVGVKSDGNKSFCSSLKLDCSYRASSS